MGQHGVLCEVKRLKICRVIPIKLNQLVQENVSTVTILLRSLPHIMAGKQPATGIDERFGDKYRAHCKALCKSPVYFTYLLIYLLTKRSQATLDANAIQCNFAPSSLGWTRVVTGATTIYALLILYRLRQLIKRQQTAAEHRGSSHKSK